MDSDGYSNIDGNSSTDSNKSMFSSRPDSLNSTDSGASFNLEDLMAKGVELEKLKERLLHIAHIATVPIFEEVKQTKYKHAEPALHTIYKAGSRFDGKASLGRTNVADNTVHDFQPRAAGVAALPPREHPFMPPSLVWSSFQEFKIVTANRLKKLEEELAILTQVVTGHPEGAGGPVSNRDCLRRIWLNKHGQWEALKDLEKALTVGEVAAAFK